MKVIWFYKYLPRFFLMLALLLPACNLQLADDIQTDEGDKWTLWSLSSDGENKKWQKKTSFSTNGKCSKMQRRAWERDYDYSRTLKGKRVGLKYIEIAKVYGNKYTKIRRVFEDDSFSITQFACYPAGFDPRKK